MKTARGLLNGLGMRTSFNCKSKNRINQNEQSPQGRNITTKNLSLQYMLFQMTFDELAAERASDGAKPSKTDTAAPTSRSDMDCKSRN